MKNNTCNNEIEINSYEELIILIEKIISKQINTIDGQIRKFYFRGQADKKWGLLPGILRDKEKVEQQELTKFIKSLSENFGQEGKKMCMALAQHYGTTTRCLDFTRNYKIALWFACNPEDKYYKNDGALFIWEKDAHKPEWFTNYIAYYVATSGVDVVSSRDFSKEIISKKDIFDEFKRTNRSTSLDNVDQELKLYLGNGFMVDFENVENNVRLKSQEAALFYFGSEYFYYENDEKIVIKKDFNRWSSNDNLYINLHELADPKIINSPYCTKIVIPHRLKNQIFKSTGLSKSDLGFF